jgi:hypothetical protein
VGNILSSNKGTSMDEEDVRKRSSGALRGVDPGLGAVRDRHLKARAVYTGELIMSLKLIQKIAKLGDSQLVLYEGISQSDVIIL